MSKFVAAAFLLLAIAANGQYKDASGNRLAVRPDPLLTADGYKSPPSEADYLAAGIVALTAQEIEADALAAQEQAEASGAAMSLPAVFDNGVAVMKDGHHIELVPVANGEPVVAIQISNSPLTAEQRAQMKAAKMAELVAKKAAKDATRNAEVDKLVKKIDKAKDVKELGNAVVAYIKSTKE